MMTEVISKTTSRRRFSPPVVLRWLLRRPRLHLSLDSVFSIFSCCAWISGFCDCLLLYLFRWDLARFACFEACEDQFGCFGVMGVVYFNICNWCFGFWACLFRWDLACIFWFEACVVLFGYFRVLSVVYFNSTALGVVYFNIGAFRVVYFNFSELGFVFICFGVRLKFVLLFFWYVKLFWIFRVHQWLVLGNFSCHRRRWRLKTLFWSRLLKLLQPPALSSSTNFLRKIIMGDTVWVKITQAKYEFEFDKCKSHLHGRVTSQKNDPPMTAKSLK